MKTVESNYLAILSLQDMVSNLSPCSTPSQVWMVLLDLTGMVPSPDSIFVRNCPRAFRLGCLSPWSKQEKNRQKRCQKSQTVHSIQISTTCDAQKRKKKLLVNHNPLFIMLSMFSAVPPAHAVYSVTNWVWLFLFSMPRAMENTSTRVRGRLIRQTMWVSWVGADRQRMTKISNYYSVV